MVSVGVMVKQLSGLLDTEDLNDWENEFVGNVVDRTQEGEVTGNLSDRQATTVERIWRKHFA